MEALLVLSTVKDFYVVTLTVLPFIIDYLSYAPDTFEVAQTFVTTDFAGPYTAIGLAGAGAESSINLHVPVFRITGK